jgi:hypothetical protein
MELSENKAYWVDKHTINIRIITVDGDIIFAKIYLNDEDQRLSDVMNDDRLFLPIYILEGTSGWVHEVIQKRKISRIREIK